MQEKREEGRRRSRHTIVRENKRKDRHIESVLIGEKYNTRKKRKTIEKNTKKKEFINILRRLNRAESSAIEKKL